jgi:hypothetical protein
MTRREDDRLQILDRPKSDLCVVRPRAPVYRLRCVALAARSVKKVRRLSQNSENLLTKPNAVQMVIAAAVIGGLKNTQ